MNTEDVISKQDALSIRRNVKSLASKKIDVDLALCEQLYYSKETLVISGSDAVSFHQYCGYDTWKEYVEHEVGMTAPKARRLVEVHAKYFVELKGIFNPKTDSIDIYKLQLLVPIINKKNCKSLIEKARTASSDSLKALLGDKVQSLHKNIGYRINKKEEKVVRKAIELAKKEFGSDLTDSQVFVAIMSEYIESASSVRKSA